MDRNGLTDSITDWLERWAAAIKSRDFEKGRCLFAPEASGFGTATFMTDELRDLVELQWRPVWSRTRDFSFDLETARFHVSEDGSLACIQSTWRSVDQNFDGVERKRIGRATIVLRRGTIEEEWKCIHTHFSSWPSHADMSQSDVDATEP